VAQRSENQTGTPAPVLYAGQARALVTQFAAGHTGSSVVAVLKVWRVGKSVLVVLALLVELGAWKPGGWTGSYRDLERRTGYGEKQVRRVMKALRALRLVVGDPLPPAQDDQGRWYRDAGTYRVMLPAWATCRHWRRPDGSKRANDLVTPTGHSRPDTRVISRSSAVLPPGDAQKPDPRARAPVDRPTLPADYVAARSAMSRQ
jgi:hypothetical protein